MATVNARSRRSDVTAGDRLCLEGVAPPVAARSAAVVDRSA
jgi:hypothetical protein